MAASTVGTFVGEDRDSTNLFVTPDGNFHAIGHATDGTQNQIVHCLSTDGGASWSQSFVTSETNPFTQTDVDAFPEGGESNVIHAVWDTKGVVGQTANFGIRYSRWDGTAWSSPSWVATNPTLGRSNTVPTIGRTTDGTLHCIYYGGNNVDPQVYYRASADNGTTWTAEFLVSTLATGQNVQYPTMVIDAADNIHVAYKNNAGTIGIAYRRHTAGSSYLAWEDPMFLDTGTYIRDPMLAIDTSDDVHMVYLNDDGSAVAQLNYMYQSAKTWATASKTQLTYGTSSTFEPARPSISLNREGTIDIYTRQRDENSTVGSAYLNLLHWQAPLFGTVATQQTDITDLSAHQTRVKGFKHPYTGWAEIHTLNTGVVYYDKSEDFTAFASTGGASIFGDEGLIY